MRVLLADIPYPRHIAEVQRLVLPAPSYLALAAWLEEREKDEVVILDPTAQGLPVPQIRERLLRERPAVVGLTAYTHTVFDAMAMAALVKECLPSAIVVMGGSHVTLNPGETLTLCPHVDFAVLGEGERTFYELLRALEEGREELAEIPGLAYLRGGALHRTPARGLIEDLDSLPVPAYHLVPMERYRAEFFTGRRDSFAVQFSRGCSYRCAFCFKPQMWGGVWRGRSAQRCADEIELLVERYGKRSFFFGDDDFAFTRARNIELCSEIVKRRLGIRFLFQTRVNHMHRDLDLLPLFREAGCVGVLLGLESASQERLDEYRKDQSLAMARTTVREVKKHIPALWAPFVWGSWRDGREDIERIGRLAAELDVDCYLPNILTPTPGTGLFKAAREKGRISTFDYTLYDFDHPVMPTETLDLEAIRRLTLTSLLGFWLHPVRLVRKAIDPETRWIVLFWWRQLLTVLLKKLKRSLGFKGTTSEWKKMRDALARRLAKEIADAGASGGQGPV